MKEKWEKLTAVFIEILKLYQEVLEIGYRKRDVLVQNSVEDLIKITKEEDVLLIQLAKLDKMQKGMIKELSQIYGLGNKKVTLNQLSQMADQEMKSNLINVEQELSKVVKELKELNEVNNQLVNQGLFIANYSLNLLTQTKASPTYNPNEKTSPISHNKALFDSKA